MSASVEPNAVGPGLDRVRIWEWSEDNHSSGLKLRCGHLAHEVQERTPEQQLELAAQCEEELREIKKDRKDIDNEWTGKVTWIHIPVNDMNLCKKVIELICQNDHADQLFRDDRWEDRLHEPWHLRSKTDVPFMDPKSWVVEFKISNGEWVFEKGIHDSSNTKPKEGNVRSTVLYMPYLHWDFLEDHCDRASARYTSPNSDQSSSMHPRRSLDEAAFRHHSYDELVNRNDDQVVTRFLRKELDLKRGSWGNSEVSGKKRSGLRLMMVDQLWLWWLDKGTIVTSFPDTPGRHDSEDRNMTRCEHLHLECLARGRFDKSRHRHNSEKLVHAIINRSYSIFTHAHVIERNLRYFDMFRKSIEDERAKAADLFLAIRSQDFHNLKKFHVDSWWSKLRGQVYKRQRDVSDVREDIDAIASTQDIEEELRIMLHIIRHQMKTLKRLVHNKHEVFQSDLREMKEDFEEMCQQAREVHERLLQTLELKQTLLSVKQNRTILIFTIITIIFLPLGFFCSIFGMNAAELTQGAPVTLGRIFTYMFPISGVISIIALFLAFGSFQSIWQSDQHKSSISHKLGRKRGVEKSNTAPV